ncbi:hypothetical protein B0J17DRAFT_630019 [Rhizoctonia solani]|nr:hypothetical protein B0J17DRAFT_630019 [Rhizoctonia solani]
MWSSDACYYLHYYSCYHWGKWYYQVPNSQLCGDYVHVLYSQTNFPLLYDLWLVAQLGQFLFNVQMGSYVYPSNNPTSIPISLEPVIGAHSAKELESAHHAVVMDCMSSGPELESTYDERNESYPQQIEETNWLLSRNKELLREISSISHLLTLFLNTSNTLVLTLWQNNSSKSYSAINQKGELPWDISEQQIVGYLNFYSIGVHLFDKDYAESLKPGKETDAKQLLANYLYNGCPAVNL